MFCEFLSALEGVVKTRTELLWKSDIGFGNKALSLRETLAEVIHYCQLS